MRRLALALALGGVVVAASLSGPTPARAVGQSVGLALGPATGNGNTALAVASVVGGGGSATLTWAGTVAQAGCVQVFVDGALWTGRNDAGISGCHLFTVGATALTWTDTGLPAGVLAVRWSNLGSITTSGGSLAYDDGTAATPSPTAAPSAPPTAAPSAAPTAAPTAAPVDVSGIIARQDAQLDLTRLLVVAVLALGGVLVASGVAGLVMGLGSR